MKMKTSFCSLSVLLLLLTVSMLSFAQEVLQGQHLEHPDAVRDFAYSPDSTTIATASSTGKVRLWDVATGTLRHTLEHPNTRFVTAVAYSPDGTTVASAHNDWKVRLWDAATGTLKNTLLGPTSWVSSVAYSPDGTTIAGAQSDSGIAYIWDAATGTLRHTLDSRRSRHEGYVAYSPDSATIVSYGTYGSNLFLWDVATGTLRHTLEQRIHRIEYFRNVAFSPDGATIASGSDYRSDGQIHIWDTASGTLLHKLPGSSSPVFSVAYSPDSRTLLSGSDAVRIWDVATGRLLNVLPNAGGYVAYSPDGTTFVGGARVWNAVTHTPVYRFDLGASSPKYSPDGATFAGRTGLKRITIYRLAPSPPPIIFTPAEVADQTFTVGTPVSLTLPFATGGTDPYTYALTPIPNGLQFNPTTRELHGTPLTAMDATAVTYTATDADGRDASLTFNITVTAAPATPITFTPSVIAPRTFVTSSPIAPVLLPVATGGTAPYTYTLAPLPDGLVFDSGTRQLTGTPTTVGSTSATYTATDAASRTASLTFTINVIDGGTPGDIPDASLAAAIRRSLGVPADTQLTAALLQQLTTLNGYAQGITTLTGLAQATNLTTLDLGLNQITDISALSSLTQLTHLYLDDNQITDISPLSGLSNLRLLRLARNPIADLLPLFVLLQQNPGLDVDIHVPPRGSGVTFADANLEQAVRAALELRSTDPLTTTTLLNLITLEAYDRRIASISGLEHATNLVALDLGRNQIVDISPLAGLTQLEVLYLDDNQIVDVSPLAGLTKLNTLFLRGNPIASLAPISHLIGGIRIFRARAAQ